MSNDLYPLVDKFLLQLKEHQQRSPATSRNYRLYLLRFLDWLNKTTKTKAGLDDISIQTVNKFHRFLSSRNLSGLNLSPATQNYHLIALRSFLKFLQQHHYKSLNPKAVKLDQAGEHHFLAIKANELERLLAAPGKAQESNLVRLRDRALLELICATGLKVSALVRLSRHNLSSDGTIISLLLKNAQAKNNFKLSHQAQYHLQQYQAARPDKNPALFVRHDRADKNHQESALTARSIQRILERYRRLAGLKGKITPSVLRHAYAFNLLKQGTDIKTVKTLLGHQHLTTTKIYQTS
jgi:site-specific recombinase XerD